MGEAQQYPDMEACIRARPVSLTIARAESFLPEMSVDEEWQRKYDAGELPEGIRGIEGSLKETWPDNKPTCEEARWILSLAEFGTWRWMGSIVLYDSNQIGAMHLIDASKKVLELEW